MTRPRARRRRTGGFTLIELLIALVVLGLVMAAALSVMRSQSKNFRVGASRMELGQDIRYAFNTIDRTLRTTGAGVAPNQPMFVFGSNDALVFNTNFASDIQDGSAVYINPDLAPGAITSLLNTQKITIPGTAIQYPDSNYFWGVATPSRAETFTIFFRPDSTTTDPSDFILFQRVNNLPPEMIARNIRAYPGRPFFDYWYDSSTTTGALLSRQLAAARVPIRHGAGYHGGTNDVGASALADSIRIVRVNLTVTNGDITADSTSRLVSTMVRMPNNGLVQIKTCGDVPILGGTLTATANAPGTPATVQLQWNRSVDEVTGEADVSQYNVYVRRQGTTQWATFVTQPAGQVTYDITAGPGLVAGNTYQYAVAAQDCTPRESSLLVSAPTIVNP